VAESSQSYPPAFLDAVAAVLHIEGGYVCNPADPGGETKFGISKRSYPNVDIKNLTPEAATAIYFADFWQKFALSDLPPEIAAKVFNVGVDIYIPPAIVCLQRACRACGGPPLDETGIIDANTKAVVAGTIERQFGVGPGAGEIVLMAALRSELAAHYRLVAANQGKRDQAFLKGWLGRAYA
jgi:lysozyme family protein